MERYVNYTSVKLFQKQLSLALGGAGWPALCLTRMSNCSLPSRLTHDQVASDHVVVCIAWILPVATNLNTLKDC